MREIDQAVSAHFSKDADKKAHVKFSSDSTPGVTGALEVTVNGTLVHSKLGGDSYVNTKEKMEKILNAIESAVTTGACSGRDCAPASGSGGAACATGAPAAAGGASCGGGKCGN